MRPSVLVLTTVLLLVALLAWVRPTGSQVPLPTPRGQLGGREPLEMATAFPFQTPPPPPTATPSPAGTPVGSPAATVGATPVADEATPTDGTG